jgi:hypothetical protein
MATCSRCGEALTGAARFCSACGAPAVSVDAPTVLAPAAPAAPAPAPAPAPAASPRGAPPGYVGTPWNVAPIAPPPPSPPAYGPGALVLVHWADGNRYPGTVLQASGRQVLVAFPSGMQQWVDLQYVSSVA